MSLMLTVDTRSEVGLNVSMLGSSSCQLTLLAVGGGGEGDNTGGGSGYLKYQTVTLELGVNTITARLGAGRQASTVSINGDPLTAEKGKSGYSSGSGSHGGYGEETLAAMMEAVTGEMDRGFMEDPGLGRTSDTTSSMHGPSHPEQGEVLYW